MLQDNKFHFDTNLDQMRQQFLSAITSKERSSNSISLTSEKYHQIIEHIKRVKKQGKKENPKDYWLSKRYDVMSIDGIERLIVPLSPHNTEIKIYVHLDELFDIINEVHVAIGHLGRDRTVDGLRKLYKNITTSDVSTFLSICQVCLKKNSDKEKKKSDNSQQSIVKTNKVQTFIDNFGLGETDVKQELEEEYQMNDFDNGSSAFETSSSIIDQTHNQRNELIVDEEDNDKEIGNISTSDQINRKRRIASDKNESKRMKAVDNIDLFFQSMAGIVKTFPSDLVSEARLKIYNIIGELQERSLNCER